MSFINQYTSLELNIKYSEEFIENGSLFIYSVGSSESGLCILKTNTEGSLVWKKSYTIADYGDLVFKKIIQVIKANVPMYFLYATSGDKHFIVKINKEGEVVKINQIEIVAPHGVYLVNSKIDTTIYLVFSGRNTQGYGGDTLSQLNIIKFDIDINAIDQQYYYTGSADNMFLNSVVSYENGIVVVFDHKGGNTHLIDINYDLSHKFCKQFHLGVNSYSDFFSHDVVVGSFDVNSPVNNKYILSGIDSNAGLICIVAIDLSAESYVYYIPKSENSHSSLLHKGNSVYLSVYDEYINLQSKVLKIDVQDFSDFLIKWVKKLNSDGSELLVSRQTYNFSSNNLTSITCVGDQLIYSDIEFNSCISVLIDIAELKIAPIIIENDELKGLIVENNLNSISVFSISNDQLPSPKIICDSNSTGLEIKENSFVQSEHLYIQSSGSIGQDSTKGVHLRWALKGALSNHLPKADYASNDFNFNKPNDYVSIYRASYIENKVRIDFKISPSLVDDVKHFWVYNVSGYVFYVYFRDTAKYNTVRTSINPTNDPMGFIKNYGDSLIEVENKDELSFAITPIIEVNNSNPAHVNIELLSVSHNTMTAPKIVTLRKRLIAGELNQKKFLSENIRSIRLKSETAILQKLEFEFYSDFIHSAIESQGWNYIGKHALTTDANIAFERLEPESGCVNNWLRFNDEAYVNIANYHEKWDGSSVQEPSRIKNVVQQYIDLSDDPLNPLANENVPFIVDSGAASACAAASLGEYEPNLGGHTQLSNLLVLQLGALDYHVARMLGLGILDISEDAMSGQYIYLAEYTTFGDLNDGLGAREMQHFYCTLPTSIEDERLPLPVDLKEIKPGIYYDPIDPLTNDPDAELESSATSFDQINFNSGYLEDGKTRVLTIYSEDLNDELYNQDFFYSNYEFESSKITIPVFAGLEYRNDIHNDWNKPELSNDFKYFNIDNTVPANKRNETKFLLIPETGYPLYIHREKENGKHWYNSYGINWFSRAKSSQNPLSIDTILRPSNTLLPPTNVNATLIRKESPLFFTSADEQQMYNDIVDDDKTLIRLTFDYNHGQELIDLHKTINGNVISNFTDTPDDEEFFADDIQIFFRRDVPNMLSGKVASTVIDASNPLLYVISSEPYSVVSSGIDDSVSPQTVPPTYNETYTPSITLGTEHNYIGSILLIGDKEYVIQNIDNQSTYPRFTVLNNQSSDSLLGNTVSSNDVPQAGSLFFVVENMQTESSWDTPNPLPFTVNIDHKTVHREEIYLSNTDCSQESHLQKFRGIFKDALIEKVMENVDLDNDDTTPLTERHCGLYRITFNIPLEQHSQFEQSNFSIEWYNGIVRLHTLNAPNGNRKVFKVIRTENIGNPNANLVIYISDLSFPHRDQDLPNYDGKIMPDNVLSVNQTVNYYPSYKVYLYKNSTYGISEDGILPENEEDVKYCVFGLRSHDNNGEYSYDNLEDFYSKFSFPTLMFAQAIREPKKPQLPLGGLYATRPDFFGKATYTFTAQFVHKPHSIQFNRASDVQFLSTIYSNNVQYNNLGEEIPSKLKIVMSEIFMNGEEPFYVNRWQNLLSFNYGTNGVFETFDGRTLPMPDNSKFIDGINNFIHEHNLYYNLTGDNAVLNLSPSFNLNTVVIPQSSQNDELKVYHFLKEAFLNCFVPLTEVPVIYNYVKGANYQPIPKKQVVRDRNGNLLSPTDPEFDMAPMMKIVEPNKIQFTDFGLDGASNAKYFYAVREINLQMKTGEYSDILGPISLVNTAPPVAPQITKIIPVIENRVLGIRSAIQLQINSYPSVQKIKKINIYRADNPTDALTVRTMKLAKVIDIEGANLMGEKAWIFTDDFSDLTEIPYGDPLFYRLTVSRSITYVDKENNLINDLAPSEASKLVVTNVVENYSPESPVVNYTADLYNSQIDTKLNYITLSWNETAYKGNYHLYKMNAQGNWVEIIKVVADRLMKGVYHLYNIDPQTGNWVNTLNPAPITLFNNTIYLPLELTNLAISSLLTKTADGSPIYHHFKVLAENTSGMFSNKENILTMYNADSYHADAGISSDGTDGMVIQGNFIVRQNN